MPFFNITYNTPNARRMDKRQLLRANLNQQQDRQLTKEREVFWGAFDHHRRAVRALRVIGRALGAHDDHLSRDLFRAS